MTQPAVLLDALCVLPSKTNSSSRFISWWRRNNQQREVAEEGGHAPRPQPSGLCQGQRAERTGFQGHLLPGWRPPVAPCRGQAPQRTSWICPSLRRPGVGGHEGGGGPAELARGGGRWGGDVKKCRCRISEAPCENLHGDTELSAGSLLGSAGL